MLFHECGNNLRTEIQLTNFLGDLSYEVKGNGNIYGYMTSIWLNKIEAKSTGKLICSECNEEVKPEDIEGRCAHCFDTDSLNNLCVITVVGMDGFTPQLVHKVECKEQYIKWMEDNAGQELKTRVFEQIKFTIQET